MMHQFASHMASKLRFDVVQCVSDRICSVITRTQTLSQWPWKHGRAKPHGNQWSYPSSNRDCIFALSSVMGRASSKQRFEVSQT